MNGDHEKESENLIAAAIDAAEDICDPLEGLVEKSATDPGAVFMPEVLERLAALKKEDRAASRRIGLVKLNCPDATWIAISHQSIGKASRNE